MPQVTLIGPVSQDTILKGRSVYRFTGGAVYYQTGVFASLGIDTVAIVTIAIEDKALLRVFPKKVLIKPIYVKKTLQFKNIYPNWDPNYRTQKADFPDNPINVKDLSPVDLEGSDAILLGPLSPSDIPLETVEYLFKLRIPLYLGVQGYLRHLEDDKIVLNHGRIFKNFLNTFRFFSLMKMK